MVQIRMAGVTHIGRRRKNNQDSLFFDEGHGIGVVADGIGGRKGGEIASTLVVDGIRQAFLGSEVIRHEEVTPFLASAVDTVNANVFGFGRNNPEYAGLGSTMECIFFSGDMVYVAHVGDSRTYLYDDGQLFQLTLDHNVENFVDRGLVHRDSLQDPGIRGAALVKAVGLTLRCELDICRIKRRPGQIYLSCSDGLTSMLEDRQVAALLATHNGNLQKAAGVLLDAANDAGGRDNITVLLARVEGR
jgi:protein phosphatase